MTSVLEKRTSPPPPFSTSGGSTITTEHLTLIGFAARLGTCVNNDAATDDDQYPGGQGEDSGKSVRDEAMLLMSLLMGKKAEEILNEEIGAGRGEGRWSGGVGRRRSRGSLLRGPGDVNRSDEGCGDGSTVNFSFSFPSLSLRPTPAATPAREVSHTAVDVEQQEGDPAPLPSQLLSRPQSIRCLVSESWSLPDSIRDSADAMAHNVLESFGAALVWRAKTWIEGLANVLALKERERMGGTRLSRQATEGVANGQDNEEGGNDDESPRGDNGNIDVNDMSNQNIDDLMNSREMQIIEAIVRSSEEVSVVNAKTAFRVLAQNDGSPSRATKSSALTLPGLGRSDQPSPKKARIADTPPNNSLETMCYKVAHELTFEATISMTSNDGVRYNGVKLQAPGYIQGTFAPSHRANGSNGGNDKVAGHQGCVVNAMGDGGEESLVGVSLALDTDVLALSLERQSRLVVRRAAEATLMAASGVDCLRSPHHMESPGVRRSVISPRYVLMSPVPNTRTYPCYGGYDNVGYGQGYGGGGELPPVPSVDALKGEGEGEGESNVGSKVSVVSSSEGHSSDSSAGTSTPLLKPATNRRGPIISPSFPALLSVANEELTKGDKEETL